MLQLNGEPKSPFKIKSIRKVTEEKPVGVCSVEAGDGTDKPPC